MDELYMKVSKWMVSPLAFGSYIVVSLLLIPLAIYIYVSESWGWELRAASIFVLVSYTVITLVLGGLLVQHFIGNYANVLAVLSILFVLILALIMK